MHLEGQKVMGKITKLNLYLSEYQYEKLCAVAASLGKDPEEVANDAVYSYLAIVDPAAEDEDLELDDDIID